MADQEASKTSIIFKNKSGKPIESGQKMIIVNLYKSTLVDKPNITYKEMIMELSKKSGIGIRSIIRIIAEYKSTKTVKSPCVKRVRPSLLHKIGDFGQKAIRRKVYSFWLNREFPTFKKILTAVSNDENIPTLKRSSMYRLLKGIGFVCTKLKRISVITEKDEIILERRKYLKKMTEYRNEGRTIYYLDEMCYDVGNYSRKKIKSKIKLEEEDTFQKKTTTGRGNHPTEKGKQLTALHIGSKKGFVDGGLIFFDDHYEINSHNFTEWFQDFLPWLDDRAVIVMDDAPYHSVKQSKFPMETWKKAEIVQWLLGQNIEIENGLIKSELLQLVKEHEKPHETYVIDEIATAQNKIVLRLPPYHCGLNPIEPVWSMVEDYVKSNHTTIELDDVKQRVIDGVKRVTAENWDNFEKQTMDEEQRIWDVDSIMDEMMDQMDPKAEPAGLSSSSDSEDDC